MSPTDPQPLAEDQSGDEALQGVAETQPLAVPAGPVPQSTRRLWMWALAAGVLAGTLTSVGGEVAWGEGRSARAPRIVAFPSPEDHARVIRGLVRSSALSFIQQGAILGAVLGLAGGLARGSARAGLLAAMIGGGLGAAMAAAASHLLLPYYYWSLKPESDSLTSPMLTHGGIWGAIGAAAGLAFGLGLGAGGRQAWAQWARCALAGLLGGVAATMVYDLVGAVMFPLDKTSQPVSATLVTRLLAQFSVALFVAAGAALVAADAHRRQTPSP